MPPNPNTDKEWWWTPPRTEAEELALGYVTVARKQAERILAFAAKYPTDLHVVRELLIEAEFAADDFGRRMEEEGASLDQMRREAERLQGRNSGGLGIQ